jgi:hypothetical protein
MPGAVPERLAAALADPYTIERELGQGGRRRPIRPRTTG